MARRPGRPKRENHGKPGDWKQVLPVGGLFAAVLITLLLGAALRTDSPEPVDLPSSPPAAPPAAQAAPAGGESDPVLNLAQRAVRDARRLRSDSTAWTLQFMLACDPANVRSRVELLADQPEFFLLPKQHDGRSCFRLCWGRFDSRQQALASTGYPRALRAVTGKPQALEIATALP